MNNLKHPSLQHVFVICATNDPSSLDCAVRRRFTFIHIGLPSLEDRIGLFKYYLNGNHALSSEDFDYLASRSDGYSPSDIEKLVATATTFFYQELYQDMIKNKTKIPPSSLPLDGRKISFEDLKHCIDNTSPTTDNVQLYDIEQFKQKHNFVKPPNKNKKSKKNSCNNPACEKKGVFRRFKIWLFGGH